ncbi:hypothetical protein M1N90_01780 [Dehalococcoidia bacterium]|nr:hypothetical protein [Dehalococcoidia bacterium]
MSNPKNIFRWIIVLMIFASISSSDYHRIDHLKIIAGPDYFSVVSWEIRHIPLKWSHLLWEMFPGNKPSDDERILIVEDYLKLTKQVNKEKNLLERGIRQKKHDFNQESSHLIQLTYRRDALKGRAEEAIEAAISSVVHKQNLGLTLGMLFPPVDISLDSPPHILVTSPRNEIKLTDKQLIRADITGNRKQEIERRVEKDPNISALVDNLSGLGTYPALVSDEHELRQIFRTSAHEWLHNYWFLRSFGQRMWDSLEMYTLNETAADIAGDEIGDLAFSNFGGDLSDPGNKYLTNTDYQSQVATILKETRQKTEILLDEKKVAEAEDYMKSQWWLLKLSGYNIRKINQAFFAFRGNYATSSSSTSPIGDELKEYRGFFPNPGSFIRSISKIKSYDQFKKELEQMRVFSTSN